MSCVVVSWAAWTPSVPGGWWACVRWSCGPFPKPGCVQGTIRNRHPAALAVAIDQVLEVAEQFGIEVPQNMDMSLFAHGDGDDPGVELPEGWKNKLRREAARRGWESYEIETQQGEENV